LPLSSSRRRLRTLFSRSEGTGEQKGRRGESREREKQKREKTGCLLPFRSHRPQPPPRLHPLLLDPRESSPPPPPSSPRCRSSSPSPSRPSSSSASARWEPASWAPEAAASSRAAARQAAAGAPRRAPSPTPSRPRRSSRLSRSRSRGARACEPGSGSRGPRRRRWLGGGPSRPPCSRSTRRGRRRSGEKPELSFLLPLFSVLFEDAGDQGTSLEEKKRAPFKTLIHTQQPPRGRLARGRCLSLVARGLRLRGAGRAVSQAQQVDNRRDGLGGFGFGESGQRRQRRRDECRSALSLLVSVQPSRSQSRCCSIPAAASSRGVQLRERRRGGGRGILCCAGGLPSTAAAAAAAATPSASAAAPRAAAALSSSSAPRRRQPVRAKVRKREEIRYVFFSTRV